MLDTKLNNEFYLQKIEPEIPDSGPDSEPASSGRLPGIIMCIVLVFVLAAGLLGISSPIFTEAQKAGDLVYEEPLFLDRLCQDNYTLYWKMAQRVDGTLLSPIDLFYPIALESTAVEGEDGAVSQGNSEYIQEFNESLQTSLSSWYDTFQEYWDGYDYLVLDRSTGQSFGNGSEELTDLVNEGDWESLQWSLEDSYTYFVVMEYDEEGHLTTPALYGAPDSSLDNLQEADNNAATQLEASSYYEEAPGQLQGPRNAVFIYAVPRGYAGGNETYRSQFAYVFDSFSGMGYGPIYFLFVCAAVLLGYCMARTKRYALLSAQLAIIPFEILVVIFNVATAMWYTVAKLTIYVFSGSLLTTSLRGEAEMLISLLLLFIICFVIFGALYCAGVALREMRVLGVREYFRRHSLIAGNASGIRRGFSRFHEWLTRIDLTEKGNRSIIKFLIINFIVLALICLTWGFGIFLLIIYSLILFGILRKYMRNLKRQYATLLGATTEMAKGRLDVRIDGSLGVFDPLKNELVKIQAGFTKAVEAETKSQNMKTELITNVSHDLKTPLTAIITYVDLLKKEDLSAEERRAYVDTLDAKSQRLKRLIEDLFEMSKASSKDISLNITQVDLPALLRQVETECRDELGGAGIEFRYQFPEQRIILPLDGDKTSRIFENLVLNVAKYAMRGTRAYVSIQIAYGYVYVEMKNVSQTELVFKGDITERFVRGDLSRSTEGSGLGLAIAKSFTEAQGGNFAIATDGDIFKALVVFPLPPEGLPGEEPAALPPTEDMPATGV